MADIFDWQPADYTLGGNPAFGDIYGNSEAAGQATVDWQAIVANGLGKWVDLELKEQYAPQDQTPRQETGDKAGRYTGGAIAGGNLAPWLLIGGAVVLVLFLALRK